MPLQLTKKNLIFSCLITGTYDVNRNTTLKNDDFSLAKEWCDSIKKTNLNGVLFHNNLSVKTCEENSNENIEFIKIDYNNLFKPNVIRYFFYSDYLEKKSLEIDNLFLTDISDVVVLNDPFIVPFFIENPDFIFCGDEPTILENEWMRSHSEHLRARIDDYLNFEETFKNKALLNCGIIGGNMKIMKEFIDKLIAIHQTYNFNNDSEYTGDMGAFNYLIRTQFNKRFFHGFPINTEFKAYQINRNDCWFRHK